MFRLNRKVYKVDVVQCGQVIFEREVPLSNKGVTKYLSAEFLNWKRNFYSNLSGVENKVVCSDKFVSKDNKEFQKHIKQERKLDDMIQRKL